MRNREEAISYLIERGYLAFARDWAVGESQVLQTKRQWPAVTCAVRHQVQAEPPVGAARAGGTGGGVTDTARSPGAHLTPLAGFRKGGRQDPSLARGVGVGTEKKKPPAPKSGRAFECRTRVEPLRRPSTLPASTTE